MAKPKAPIYTLPHGIEVIGEYAAKGKNRYWRVRIRPHPFFPNVPVISDGCLVRRSRVILASKLGRALTPEEHAHHGDENRNNDMPHNIESLSPAEHNRHHKRGWKHSPESRGKISAGLRRAISEGRRLPPPRPDRRGIPLSEETKHRISSARKAGIANGSIKKQTPPSALGRVESSATRAKKSAHARQRPRDNGRFI